MVPSSLKLILFAGIAVLIALLVATIFYYRAESAANEADNRVLAEQNAVKDQVIERKKQNVAAIKKKTEASQDIQDASEVVEEQINDLPHPTILIEGDAACVARSLVSLFNNTGVRANSAVHKQSPGASVLPGTASSDPSSCEPVALEDFFGQVRELVTYTLEVEATVQCYTDAQKAK